MSRLVQMRWPDELVEAVDARAGSRGRTRFAVEAVKAALAQGAIGALPEAGSQESGETAVEVSDSAVSPSEPLRANYGSLEGRGVVRDLEVAEEGLERPERRFRCGCVTQASSSRARCPRHGHRLAE